MLNKPCIPGTNPTWEWCIILFTHYWIQFSSIFWWLYMTVYWGGGALHNEAINFWSSLVQKNATAVKCAVMFLFHLLKRNSCEMRIRLLSYECKKGGGERSEHAYDPTWLLISDDYVSLEMANCSHFFEWSFFECHILEQQKAKWMMFYISIYIWLLIKYKGLNLPKFWGFFSVLMN